MGGGRKRTAGGKHQCGGGGGDEGFLGEGGKSALCTYRLLDTKALPMQSHVQEGGRHPSIDRKTRNSKYYTYWCLESNQRRHAMEIGQGRVLVLALALYSLGAVVSQSCLGCVASLRNKHSSRGPVASPNRHSYMHLPTTACVRLRCPWIEEVAQNQVHILIMADKPFTSELQKNCQKPTASIHL